VADLFFNLLLNLLINGTSQPLEGRLRNLERIAFQLTLFIVHSFQNVIPYFDNTNKKALDDWFCNLKIYHIVLKFVVKGLFESFEYLFFLENRDKLLAFILFIFANPLFIGWCLLIVFPAPFTCNHRLSKAKSNIKSG